MAANLRQTVQRVSVAPLERMSTLPKVVPFIVVLALVIGGAFLPGPGWLLLVVAAAFLGWLLYLGWPRLTTAERLMRLAVLALLVAVAVTRAFPRG